MPEHHTRLGLSKDFVVVECIEKAAERHYINLAKCI
jgi:hypothetical protein